MLSRRVAFLAAAIVLNMLLFTLHHAVGAAINHGDYTPFSLERNVSPNVQDTTYLYSPGPEKFFRFRYLGSEMAVFELRHVLGGYPTLHYVVVGGAALLLGNLERGAIFCQALFPTLVWLAFYRLAKFGLEESWAAAALAWTCCLFAFSPRTLLLINWAFPTAPLELTRIPQPGISMLLFLICLLTLEWSTRPQRSWRQAAGAGLVSGLLFYAYYFYAVAFFGGLGIWLAASILRRNRETPLLLAYGAGGTLTAAPYLWITVQGIRSGMQTALQARVGTFTHAMQVNAMISVLLALAAFALLYWKYGAWLVCSDRLRIAIPLAAVVIAALAGINLQVLTGYDPQHLHFQNRVIQPIGLLLLVGAIFMVLEKRLAGNQKLWRTCCVDISLILVVLAGIAQARSGIRTASSHRASDPRMDMVLWMRNHLPPDAVISSTDDKLFGLIPAIAGTWSFVPQGDTTLASNQEILTRFMIASRLEGQDWQHVASHLQLDTGEYNELSTTSYNLFTDRHVTQSDAWMREAHQLWNTLDVGRELQTRRLDYMILRRDGSSASPSRILYENRDWELVPLARDPTPNARRRGPDPVARG